MKIYEVTVIDKDANPSGEEPMSFESYVAVLRPEEVRKDPDDFEALLGDFTDEDIHYYFTEDEFKPINGEIETEEFKYLIGKRVA